jgi:hypothetical protein
VRRLRHLSCRPKSCRVRLLPVSSLGHVHRSLAGALYRPLWTRSSWNEKSHRCRNEPATQFKISPCCSYSSIGVFRAFRLFPSAIHSKVRRYTDATSTGRCRQLSRGYHACFHITNLLATLASNSFISRVFYTNAQESGERRWHSFLASRVPGSPLTYIKITLPPVSSCKLLDVYGLLTRVRGGNPHCQRRELRYGRPRKADARPSAQSGNHEMATCDSFRPV